MGAINAQWLEKDRKIGMPSQDLTQMDSHSGTGLFGPQCFSLIRFLGIEKQMSSKRWKLFH